MSETTKAFSLGVILSVTTGVLLTGMGEVYRILGFMTGETLVTHQLPRASRECSPELLRQHPQLTGVDASSVCGANWRQWLDAQEVQFGKALTVESMTSREPKYDTPVADLIEVVGDPTKVMVIDV